MTATDNTLAPSEGEHHTPDIVYIKVALVLAFFTAIEVFTYFESVHQMSDTLITLTLCVLMVVKFALVAAYFMHLKFDNAIFTKMIGSGLVLAYPIYMVAAYAMGFLEGWNGAAKVALLAVPPIIGAVWLLFAWKGGDAHDATH